MENTTAAPDVIDVQATVIADNPSLPVAAKVAPVDVKSNLAVFDPIKAVLAELTLIITSTRYDINTPAGEATARELRTRCVKLRTGTDDLYKERNTPLLELQREMRKIVAEIAAGIAPHEKKLDEAIKEKDRVREEERQRKVAIEEARVNALRDKIKIIAALPAQVVNFKAAGIATADQGLARLEIDEASFGEFAEEANDLRAYVRGQLGEMFEATLARETATENNRLEALRLDEERRKLQQQAADAIAEAKKITDAANELARQQAEAAAAERQRDADAATERQRLADEQHAARGQELKRQQDAFEAEKLEAKRAQDEKDAALKAERDELQRQLDALKPKPAAVAPEPATVAEPEPAPVLAAPEVKAIVLEATSATKPRPRDEEIVAALAARYDATPATVIGWLRAFDANAAEFSFEYEEIPA